MRITKMNASDQSLARDLRSTLGDLVDEVYVAHEKGPPRWRRSDDKKTTVATVDRMCCG